MPYMIVPEGDKHCVYTQGADKKPMGKSHGCHPNRPAAMAQMRALYANVPDAGSGKARPVDFVSTMANHVKGLLGLKASFNGDQSFGDIEEEVRSAWYATQPKSNGMVDSDCWVRGVYADYLVARITGGDYQKIPYSKGLDGAYSFGTPIPVEQVWREIPAGKTMIFKQTDGQYRFVGWVSNHFRDQDTPAEILSAKAHQEFVAWADETGSYPEVWLWHVPGSKVGVADWLDFSDGFLIISGLFDEDTADVAERLAKSTESLTMSHGFYRLKADPASHVTHSYRMVEATICPEGVEANPWTRFTTTQEVDPMLSPKKKEFLVKYLGEDRVSKLEGDTTALQKAAETAGVDWKTVDAIVEDQPADSATKTLVIDPAPAMDVKALTEALVPALMAAMDVKALSDTIAVLKDAVAPMAQLQTDLKALQESVEALKATDDAKIAIKMTPKAAPAQALSWSGKVASRSAETVVDKTDPIVGQKPAFDSFVDAVAASVASAAAQS